ncbi:MAG: exodeoxyribonuclease VII large subunit [Lentisphaerae bacterium]|nr:exodeoxyribonuclease VII large subunit [Lentisphaerota bacterium]
MTAIRKVFCVSELTRFIKTTLESEIGDVWVEGELSNVRRPSSGHCYFTIKDESSQISGVLFRGDQKGLKFELKDGALVRVFGGVSVYERSGNYQIIVRRIEESGQGLLQARFEALKEKLQKEGAFDSARKKPLPLLPRHVGIVTSRTGAALRDILNVVSRRFPNIHIALAPVRVQGEGAAQEIAEAIDTLNSVGGLDVLIVGRGGGSMEDLWCFNEEIVARAIIRSDIPVISAVGHEIDFTISDFVADLRAPTPSAAAELVVGRKEEFEQTISDILRRLTGSCRESVLVAKSRLAVVKDHYILREPGNMARQYLQTLDGLEMRMAHVLKTAMAGSRETMRDCMMRMGHHAAMRQRAVAQEVKRLDAQLTALSPLAVLGRGYSVTINSEGRVIKSVADVVAHNKVLTRLADGTFSSTVDSVSVDNQRINSQ